MSKSVENNNQIIYIIILDYYGTKRKHRPKTGFATVAIIILSTMYICMHVCVHSVQAWMSSRYIVWLQFG